MRQDFQRVMLLVLGVLSAPALGEPPASEVPPPSFTLPNTEVRTLPARGVEGITYKLYVSLPKSYAQGEQRYPVVYLLDADYSFALAHNIVEHMSDRGHMKELILVGIAYDGPLRYRLNRTRDYTPTHTLAGGYGPEYQQHSGGGPAFRAFLAGELIPFIDRTYRTGSERTLVGHSYGGLFSTWVAFTRPELFTHYLIVSPSLWYDERHVFRVEEAYAKAHGSLAARMYFSVGSREVNEERDMVVDLRTFTTRVQRRGYRGLTVSAQVLEDETHNSVFPAALSNGLRRFFGR